MAAITQTAWCLKQLQLAFLSKNFQANTAKLGIAFGRARPNVGTYRPLRDALTCFKTFYFIENYSKIYIIMYREGGIMIFKFRHAVSYTSPLKKIFLFKKTYCSSFSPKKWKSLFNQPLVKKNVFLQVSKALDHPRPLNIPQNKNMFFWQHLTLKKSKDMRYIA